MTNKVRKNDGFSHQLHRVLLGNSLAMVPHFVHLVGDINDQSYGSVTQTVHTLYTQEGTMTEWQPIETAPKDGKQVLVYGYWEGELHDRDDNPAIYQAYYWVGDWNCIGGEYYSAYVRNPTHWMPLPEPPRE